MVKIDSLAVIGWAERAIGPPYNTALLDGLQTALGTQFGLDQVDGYAKSGDFQLYFSGASRDSFDFGDCGQTRLSSPQHFWLGTHYRTPRHSWFRYAALQERPERSDVFDLLWYDASAKLWWFLHTQAKIELSSDGREATFSRRDRRLQVVLRDPPAARFEVMEAKALPAAKD